MPTPIIAVGPAEQPAPPLPTVCRAGLRRARHAPSARRARTATKGAVRVSARRRGVRGVSEARSARRSRAQALDGPPGSFASFTRFGREPPLPVGEHGALAVDDRLEGHLSAPQAVDV